MDNRSRREPWRRTHAVIIERNRSGRSGNMTRRLEVPLYRGGQGRSVEVLLGEQYVPLTWEASDPRVAALKRYEPREHVDAWCRHQEQTLDLVLRTDYYSELRDRHLAGTLHYFFTWAENRHYSTDPGSLLSGDRIDLFIRGRYRGHASRATHRWRLRHVAATVFPPPDEERFCRNPAMAPFTHSDRDRFRHAALQIVAGRHAKSPIRQALYRDVLAVLALTFGAGCNGKAVHRIEEGWVRSTASGVWLHRPDREVPTPIADPWGPILLDLRSGHPRAWFVRPDTPGARNEQVGKIFFRARKISPGLRGFDTDRAARRWHVDVLQAAHFDVIAAMLGYKPGSQTPADLVTYLEPSPPRQARQLMRGWVR